MPATGKRIRSAVKSQKNDDKSEEVAGKKAKLRDADAGLDAANKPVPVVEGEIQRVSRRKGDKKGKAKKMIRPQCFLDINIGGKSAGRVVIELFKDVAPMTCENFRALCTGEKGEGAETGAKLHYQGSKFHNIVPNFLIQGGDFENNDGTGGESIYGGAFDDEENQYNHIKPGTVSMANTGKDGNRSQFFILTSKNPQHFLDKKHVVFGRVVKGMDVVYAMDRQGTKEGKPKLQVEIAACGRIKDKALKKAIHAKAEKKAAQEAPTVPQRTEEDKAQLKCDKCGGSLKYVKRLPKKGLVRFWCKDPSCGNMMSLPDRKKA